MIRFSHNRTRFKLDVTLLQSNYTVIHNVFVKYLS